MLPARDAFLPGAIVAALVIMLVAASPVQAQFGRLFGSRDSGRDTTQDPNRTIDRRPTDTTPTQGTQNTRDTSDFDRQQIDARRTDQQNRQDELNTRPADFDTTQTDRRNDRQAEAEAQRAQLEARREELEARRQELRREAEVKKEEVRQRQAERRAEIAANHARRISARFDAYFDRLNNIMAKIQSRIDKLEQRGIDVTRVQAKFDDTLASLEAARALAEEAATSFNAIPLGSFEAQQQEFDSARTNALGARDAFQEALRSMREVVELLKIVAQNQVDPNADVRDARGSTNVQ